MSIEGHLMALLEEGNPAPELGDEAPIDLDASTYLAAQEQRRQAMTQLETKEAHDHATARSNTRWLVAAFVVLILGIAVLVFTQNQPAPVAGLAETVLTGSEDDPGAVEAFSAVEAAYAAFNAGDLTWIDIRMRGSYYGPADEEEANRERERAYWTDVMAADPRDEVVSCVSRGWGEWPALVDPETPTPTGFYFNCLTRQTDSLLDLAGVGSTFTYHWVVDDSGVVAVGRANGSSNSFAFLRAFTDWLSSTHAEASGDLVPLLEPGFDSVPGYGFNDPQTRTRILDYAEEFVAQSDVYPLEATDS